MPAAGFTRPDFVSPERMEARKKLLEPLQERAAKDFVIADYEVAQSEALRLAGPGFMRNFKLSEEPGSLRQGYGGEFGQRCLLARRLVQAGVRFIEVSHNLNFMNGTGWDVHNKGIQNQHLLIKEMDTALAALIRDLEDKKLLDKTLIVVATEFLPFPPSSTAAVDVATRAPPSPWSSPAVAKHSGAYGVTDDLAKHPVENSVPLADFHATIHAAMGIDPTKERWTARVPCRSRTAASPSRVCLPEPAFLS